MILSCHGSKSQPSWYGESSHLIRDHNLQRASDTHLVLFCCHYLLLYLGSADIAVDRGACVHGDRLCIDQDSLQPQDESEALKMPKA